MEIVSDSRLLVATLAPLLGAGLVMLTGRRPNLREGCSLAAAGVLFATVASLVPEIRAGRQLEFVLAELLPGLRIALTMNPSSAMRMAGAKASASGFDPYFCSASASPATVPGTATAA